jgi:spermidine/putrescine transport system ATP-binding protein
MADIVGGEKVLVEVDFDKVELMDDKEDGTLMGDVRFILYKGDRYHLTVRTENEDNIYVDTHDVWDDRDIVGIRIQPDDLKIKRV